MNEAHKNGARLSKIFEVVGISIRTYQRWVKSVEDKRKTTIRPIPKNRLTFQEEQEILKVINSIEYQDLPPTQIVPRLADKGIYLASESTMYRIMKKYNENAHRGKAKQAVKRPLSSHVANSPNEVWTWDITWIASNIKGKYYKLYLIVDIYSRMIVAWEDETSENASILIEKAVISQKLCGKPVVLHSDNGSPMKGATFQATMERLGLIKSYSRPRVSNDNPYSEALFRTLKYCPKYPKFGFIALEDTRDWVSRFVKWYNEKHMHSGINYVTPKSRHEGKDKLILEKRTQLYEACKNNNPIRWSKQTRNWNCIGPVALNPVKENEKTMETA